METDTYPIYSQLIGDFKLWLYQKDRKPGGIFRHANNLRFLLKYCPTFTKPQVDACFLDLKERGRKNAYIYTLINTVRVYSQYLKDKNMPYSEENISYKYPKKEIYMKSTMSDSEIESFLLLPPTRGGEKEGANWKVWQLFFTIMAYTGMRPGEIAHLTIEQVDFGRGVFVLDVTKTGLPRYVPIPPSLTKALEGHIQGLAGLLLFPSRRGGNKDGFTPVFDNVDWHENFHKRIKRLGIKRKNLTPAYE